MNKKKLMSIGGVVLAALGMIATFASDMLKDANTKEEIREQVLEVLSEMNNEEEDA